jgi:hypothetical protein
MDVLEDSSMLCVHTTSLLYDKKLFGQSKLKKYLFFDENPLKKGGLESIRGLYYKTFYGRNLRISGAPCLTHKH